MHTCGICGVYPNSHVVREIEAIVAARFQEDEHEKEERQKEVQKKAFQAQRKVNGHVSCYLNPNLVLQAHYNEFQAAKVQHQPVFHRGYHCVVAESVL